MSMSSKQPPLVSLSQLEEALEERVNPDRRQKTAGLPENVHKERRKSDRRAGKTKR